MSQRLLATHSFRLGRLTVLVDIPAEETHEGPAMTLADMERGELAAADLILKSSTEGQHSGEAFRFCRKTLGLKREEFASAMGVEVRRVEFAERNGDVPEAWRDYLYLRVNTRLFELGAPLLRARIHDV